MENSSSGDNSSAEESEPSSWSSAPPDGDVGDHGGCQPPRRRLRSGARGYCQSDSEADLDDDPDALAEEALLMQGSAYTLPDQPPPPKLVPDRFARLEAMLSKSCVYGDIIREQIRAMCAAEASVNDVLPDKRSRKDAESTPKRLAVEANGRLMPHQLEGARWLLSLYMNGVNGILADDMGLGKTIQTVAFIAELFANRVFGTHLIVAPLSTIENWRSEFAKWAPWISTTVYHGQREQRQALRSWLRQRSKNRKKPVVMNSMMKDPPEVVAGLVGGVVLASYEMVMADAQYLRKSLGVKWRVLVVDEAHRLKNFECKLIKVLRSFDVEARVLLTGTPLQNKLAELWSILNFVVPELFDKLSEFEEWFELDFEGDGNSTGWRKPRGGGSVRASALRDPEQQLKIVAKMHRVLRPFMLRRTKADVLGLTLPPKYEVVMHCPLHKQQQKQYEAIRSSKKYEHNRLVQLRKVCCHPHLFPEFDPFHDQIVKNNGSTHFPDEKLRAEYLKRLVHDSSKLHLLHRMLPPLRAAGHKVLLFSQFTRNLDIVQDYLEHVEMPFVRLDGSTDIETRKQNIAAFSGKGQETPGSDSASAFVFLISTRAGGLGLNLVAADTVVLYDGDFNPYNDLQAIDRCHRIGQTRPVVVYRLVCPKTVEEALLNIALRKLRLERLVIGAGKFCNVGGTDDEGEAATQRPKRSDTADPVDGPGEVDIATLQDVHAQTMSMRFGDTSIDDLSDEVLQMLTDRVRVAEYCKSQKRGDDR